MSLGTEVNSAQATMLDGSQLLPPKRGTAPSFQFMSIVAKRLDG